MKKYLLGFTALVIAISLSAFTKPVKKVSSSNSISEKFQYAITSYGQNDVKNPANWTNGNTVSCTSASDKPCEFIVTDERYVHSNGLTYELNTHDYIISTNPAPESGDLEAIVPVTQGSTTGQYIVQQTSFATSVINKAN